MVHWRLGVTATSHLRQVQPNHNLAKIVVLSLQGDNLCTHNLWSLNLLPHFPNNMPVSNLLL